MGGGTFGGEVSTAISSPLISVTLWSRPMRPASCELSDRLQLQKAIISNSVRKGKVLVWLELSLIDIGCFEFSVDNNEWVNKFLNTCIKFYYLDFLCY